MTLPKIKRSHSLRALLITGVVFAIGGVSFAGAARPDVDRAPRSVALVKAHQSTARPRPKQVTTLGARGLPGQAGQPPAGSEGPKAYRGPMGAPGLNGEHGLAGADGADGTDGVDGARWD